MVLWSCSRCRPSPCPCQYTNCTSESESDQCIHNKYGNVSCKNAVEYKYNLCRWPPLGFSFKTSFRIAKKILVSKFQSTLTLKIVQIAHFLVLLLIGNIFTLSQGAPSSSSSSSGPANHHYTSHTVITKYGALRGLKVQFSSSSTRHLDPVSAFLGIPYASPPVNAYRFMPPVAPLPWGPGTKLAATLPPACPQRFPDISNRTKALQSMTIQRYLLLQKLIPFVANQSEDCLYLNFYVPTVPTGEEIRPGRFAILFVIHGESWDWGSGNEFDGGILASIGNHIVVTFNYRLGVLGFLKTSNQQSNFGLLDVIAALHWVRENGDAFGGDRNRISILGYRTGAVIANLLMVAQIAKDLFQRAILISGSVLSPWALQWNPEEVAFQASIHFGCKGRLPLSHPESDLAPCLRRKDLSELLQFVPNSPRFLSPFAPFIDNILLKNPRPLMMESLRNNNNNNNNIKNVGASERNNNNNNNNNAAIVSSSSSSAAAAEQFHSAQLIIIFSTSEGVHELNDHELRHGFELEHRDRIFRTLVRNVFNYHQQEIFSIIRNEYTDWDRPIVHPIPLRDATVEALSDCLVIAPVIQLALSHSMGSGTSSSGSSFGNGNGSKLTYLLHFSHVSREVDFTPYERLGSLEGDVVPYLMGLPVTSNIPPFGGQQFLSPWSSLANFSKQDAIVSETLLHYLTNFVKTGDPNLNDVGPPSSKQQQHGGALEPDEWTSISSGNGGGAGGSREKIRSRSLHWEPFELSSQLYLNIGIKPKLKSHYRGHKLALWLNLIPQIHLSGGPEVTLNHHTFHDDNPKHYIGTIRHHYQLSFRDQIPGVETNIFQKHQQQSSSSSSSSSSYGNEKSAVISAGGSGSVTVLPPGVGVGVGIGTTECIETTAEGFPQGSPNQIEIEEDTVRMNVDSSSSHSHISGFEVVNGEYDYTTALTVTLTVGICLILLNLVVFSAIMCHRKRGLASETLSMSTTGSPGSRLGNNSGTPLKSPYKNDFKWTPCSPNCNTSHQHQHHHQQHQHHQGSHGHATSAAAVAGIGAPSTSSSHLSYPGESIALSQYNQHGGGQEVPVELSSSPSAGGYAQLDFNRQHQQMNCCQNSSSLMRNTNNMGIGSSMYSQCQPQYSEDDDDENERPLSPFMIMAAAAAAEMIQQQEQHAVQLQAQFDGSVNPCHSKQLQYHLQQQHQHQHHRSRVQIPFPNCSTTTNSGTTTMSVPPQQAYDDSSIVCGAAGVGGGIIGSGGGSSTLGRVRGGVPAGGTGSIRLYMNQNAGDDNDGGLVRICGGTNSLPRNLYSHTTCNTNSLSRLKPIISHNPNNVVQSPSSSATTTSLSTTPITVNPTGTTLVGVLKRHSGSGSSNTTTVKKRVQIQEISV